MTEYGELSGDEGVILYRLYYHGGPDDGVISHGFRPYYQFKNPDGSIYEIAEGLSPENKDEYVEWVDDFTRAIHLYYRES